MGNGAYSKRLRVAGNVQPGSIKRTGTHVQFVLVEQDQLLSVDYTGTEAPPDTFKDDSQALADGSFGHDCVFHAKALQANARRSMRRSNPARRRMERSLPAPEKCDPTPVFHNSKRLLTCRQPGPKLRPDVSSPWALAFPIWS
jgi:cytochrome c-type biogenesis protein CcmE